MNCLQKILILLEKEFNFKFKDKNFLVTYHPETLTQEPEKKINILHSFKDLVWQGPDYSKGLSEKLKSKKMKLIKNRLKLGQGSQQ